MHEEFMSLGLPRVVLRNLCIYSGHYYKASSGLIFTSSLLLSLRLFSAFFDCFSFLFISLLIRFFALLCKCLNDFEFCQNS